MNSDNKARNPLSTNLIVVVVAGLFTTMIAVLCINEDRAEHVPHPLSQVIQSPTTFTGHKHIFTDGLVIYKAETNDDGIMIATSPLFIGTNPAPNKVRFIAIKTTASTVAGLSIGDLITVNGSIDEAASDGVKSYYIDARTIRVTGHSSTNGPDMKKTVDALAKGISDDNSARQARSNFTIFTMLWAQQMAQASQ